MKHLVFIAALLLFLGSARAELDSSLLDSSDFPEEGFFKEGADFERYVKFVVMLNDVGQPQLLIFQNPKFNRHVDFLKTLPQFSGLTYQQIDDLSYKAKPARKVILGVLTLRGLMTEFFGITLI
jgi:hypothetical protein